jgi:chemotaxis signal transduction protein
MNNEAIQDQHFLDGAHAEKPIRRLQFFRAGSLLCGIFEDEIATVAKWREPTPLPQAPKSVMGVVSIQGRMLTVLNLVTLLDSHAASSDASHQHILALRGDEQLALAVDALGENIEIGDAVLESAQESGERLVLGVFDHDGAEISILNVRALFPSAIQGRERRRRRF